MEDKLGSISRDEHAPLLISDSAEILAELSTVVRRARNFLSASWLVPLLFSLVLFVTDPVKRALSSSVASVVTCSGGTIGPTCVGPTNRSGVHTITAINFRLPESANPLAWLGTHIWFWGLALALAFAIVGTVWVLRIRSSKRIKFLQQAAIAAASGVAAIALIDLAFGLFTAGYLMGLAFSICVWAAMQGSVDMMVVGGAFLVFAGPSTKFPLTPHSFGGLQISPQAEIHTFWAIFLLTASMVIFLRTHSSKFMYLKRLGRDLPGMAGKSVPR